MSITSAIHSARSGLQITGLRADIVATNVANASNPGYVRRSVVIGETLVGTETTGVQSNGIARAGNAALTAERTRLSSDLSKAGLLASSWTSLSARLGDGVETGLFAAFTNLETTAASAANTPESSTEAASFLSAAKSVTSELRALSEMTQSMRAEADSEIEAGVKTVNAALVDIQALNARLASVKPGSSQAAALRDERQRAVDTVAEYIPVRTVERQSGAVDVLTTEGVYLLAGEAREIEFTPSVAFDSSQTLASGLSGLTVDGTDITPGAATFGAISSGIMGGLFQLRDQDLTSFSNKLDSMAENLIARVTDPAIDPSLTVGDAGLFVDTGSVTGPGLAGRIGVNTAVDLDAGGDLWRLRDGIGAVTEGPSGNSSILTALSGAFSSVQPVNGTAFQGAYSMAELSAHFASLTGQQRITQEAVLSSASSQYGLIAEAEQTETGVDIDAQMQDLLLIEQAYAANARVIEVASQLLNRLMEL